jgi:hypothetical protein
MEIAKFIHRDHWHYFSSRQSMKQVSEVEEKPFTSSSIICPEVCWIRSSRGVRASDCQCQSRNSLGFDPSVFRHIVESEADEAVLKKVHEIEYSTVFCH